MSTFVQAEQYYIILLSCWKHPPQASKVEGILRRGFLCNYAILAKQVAASGTCHYNEFDMAISSAQRSWARRHLSETATLIIALVLACTYALVYVPVFDSFLPPLGQELMLQIAYSAVSAIILIRWFYQVADWFKKKLGS